jgi:hypothetical protein
MDEDARFLPPGVVVVALTVAVFGMLVAIMASPVLGIRGGATISVFGLVVYETAEGSLGPLFLGCKGLVGISFIVAAVGLLRLRAEARAFLVLALSVVGIGVPLVTSVHAARIDTIFLNLFRVASILVSSACTYYLTLAGTERCFAEGGAHGSWSYRYCPICGARGPAETATCRDCETGLLDCYRTDDGMVFARPVAAPVPCGGGVPEDVAAPLPGTT